MSDVHHLCTARLPMHKCTSPYSSWHIYTHSMPSCTPEWNMHHRDPKWHATQMNSAPGHICTYTSCIHSHTPHQHTTHHTSMPRAEVWERNTLTATRQLKHHISPCINYTIPQLTHWSFQTLLLPQAPHFMRSKKFTNKKQKIFSEKQGFRDGLYILLHPSKKQRNKGKCHYPASVPSIPKFYINVPKAY